MIGFVVCVNYADCLVHTLPSSSKLFEKLYVITSERDPTTLALSLPPNCEFFVTEEFWSPGASFNKFAALEKCIDYVGRYARKVYGIIDADIVFPEIIKPAEELFQRECLTVPFRRMYYGDMPFPGVQDWEKLTRHRLVRHFSGYAQFFWANDPVLRNKPLILQCMRRILNLVNQLKHPPIPKRFKLNLLGNLAGSNLLLYLAIENR